MSNGVQVCRELAGATVCGAILLAAKCRPSAANYSGAPVEDRTMTRIFRVAIQGWLRRVAEALALCVIAPCMGIAPACAQEHLITIDGTAGVQGNGANDLHYPYGVAVDISGNVYVADGLNFRVQKIQPNGTVSTFAQISAAVTAVAVDSVGNVFFSDNTGNIYEGASATVVSSPGTGIAAIAFDSNNNMYVLLNPGTGYAVIVGPNGQEFVGADTFDNTPIDGMTIGMHDGEEYLYTYVNGMVLNATPNYGYLPVAINLSTQQIIQLTASNAISVGGAGLTTAFATSATGDDLYMIAGGGSYVEDLNFVSNTFGPFAGTGKNGYNGDGIATSSEINQAQGLAIGPGGVLYIADTANDLVRRVSVPLVGPTSLTKTDTIPNFGSPCAINPSTNKFYLAVTKGNYTVGGPAFDIVVYSTLNDTVVADIPIGSQVEHIAVDSVNNFIYATRADGNVTVIDSTNDTVNAVVPVGIRPMGVDVDPGLNLAYVANAGDTKISVIAGPVRSGNTETAATPAGNVGGVLPLGPIAVDPVNHVAYAVVAGSVLEPGTVNYSLAMIQGNAGGSTTLVNIVSYIPAGTSATLSANAISVDTTSGRVAIADAADTNMQLYDPATQAFSTYSFAFHPATLAVDSTSEHVFLTDGYGNVGFADLTSGYSEQIHTAPDGPDTQMSCGSQGSVVAIDPTTEQGYFTTCDGQSAYQVQLHLFDGVLEEEVASPIALGNPVGQSGSASGDFALAVDSATHSAWVSNLTPNTSEVDVINGLAPSARPVLQLSPASIDFGSTWLVGQTAAPQVVTVMNTGTVPLTSPVLNPLGASTQIDIPASSNQCATVTTIAAGGSCTFSVGYTFSASGSIDAGIEVLDNAGDTPQLIGLTGSATQPLTTLTITSSPSPLPIGTVNSVYPGVNFTVSNSTGYVYVTQTGSLPSGLTFNGYLAPYTLTGTPTQAGTFPFTISATDQNGDSGSQTFTIVVNPVGGGQPAVVSDNETITVTDTETFPDVADSEKITVTDSELVRAYNAITITPSPASFNASSGNGYATYAYTPVQFSAAGGTGSLTLTETGLPTVITFINGQISGTPSTSSVGTYPFSVTATDADGDQLTVQGYSLTIQPASAHPAQVTDNESITVTDTETFPDVADAEQITVTDTVTVTVGSTLAITTTGSLPTGYVNALYPATTINASGGSTPYTWSATGLPSSLSIGATTGVISGTPASQAGSPFTVTVTVIDSTGNKASANYSITIDASTLAITTTGSLPTGYVNALYPATTINASGGSTPYTWSATGLPSGLSIGATTGVISGTPASQAALLFTVTVTVIDSAGNKASANLSLAVLVAELKISANPDSLTIAQGQTGETTLTFTPSGGYSGTLALGCSGLPAYSLCVFTQNGASVSSVTLSGNNQPVNVVLTFETDVKPQLGRLGSATTSTPPDVILPAIAFWWSGSLMGLTAFTRRRKMLSKNLWWIGLCILLLLTAIATAGLAGCGGESNSGMHITPVGNSTVTVSATSGSGTAQTLSIDITIAQ